MPCDTLPQPHRFAFGQPAIGQAVIAAGIVGVQFGFSGKCSSGVSVCFEFEGEVAHCAVNGGQSRIGSQRELEAA